MWEAVSAAPLPIYSYRKEKRKQSKPDITQTSPSTTTPSTPNTSNVAPELLEPAVDGPPSPERLRQLTKQMRGNMLERNHQHQPSSGSSSLRSFTSADRPSWEQTLESISLSRRSSSRSTNSSMPSRERPDSVQIFGKAIFNRRGKLKRESKSSSGSSLHSGEIEAPLNSNPTKDYFIPVVLRRRRATTTTMKEANAAEAASLQKKIQISGPYNFQHVTHARRDTVPDIPAQSMQMGEEMNHFSNFSSEAIHLSGQQDSPILASEPHTRISVSKPLMLRSQTSPPRRLMKRTQSQEQIRVAPPRPPRSPPLEPGASSPPVPPPRTSSRATLQHGEYDQMFPAYIERPATEHGFRQAQPFSPHFEYPGSEAPLSAPGFDCDPDEMDEYFDPRFSHAITTPDDAAWPMTSSGTFSFENTLPEVPEEEEHQYYTTTRSRLSINSTTSSLRGSYSVPALRTAAQRQSNTSDTLGRFDMGAAQKTLKESMDHKGEALPKDNWEDVIDYCYDHEAEADFDYEWERPSLDMARTVESCTPPAECRQRDETSPYLTTPGRFDVPELSPASQISNTERDEVLTPLIPQAPSNFSLPRKELPQQQQQGQQGQRTGKPDRVPHIRTPSHASSFKESHGFTLSPSLLIPNDYHQQMLLSRAEDDYYPGDEEWVEAKANAAANKTFLADPQPTTLDPDVLRAQLRGSVSSIGTESSVHSGPSETSSAERHISTTSTSTAYSRFTVNSNPDELTPGLPADKLTSTTEITNAGGLHSITKDAVSDAMDSSDNVSIVGELPPASVSSSRREHSRNRSAPLNVVVGDNTQRSSSPKETLKTRRARSKTTSSVGGTTPTYGLFPTVNVQPGNRI
ncbi:hypothetical protein MKZ38_000515 [Zalerion maritima]|uniref:CRIB domain-containing protein n=1 Tax=Zalerion maritima TaxID=339359 RepID=A0AAD5RFK5_9PEZI|nr:hypothetical protein MKZ38_000515 [Zalerion maritima]